MIPKIQSQNWRMPMNFASICTSMFCLQQVATITWPLNKQAKEGFLVGGLRTQKRAIRNNEMEVWMHIER
jgi:hypothetical protein